MSIVRLHPDDPSDYCCNLYWVIADGNPTSGCNTLVDAGSSRADNLPFLLRRMEAYPKGIGKRAVEQVVITHGHYDHVGGLQALVEHFHPQVLAFRKEPGVDQELADGSWIRMGDKAFRVLHTPGHSEDSICLHCPETGALFSGDTLYRISDASGSYPECYARSLERIRGLAIGTIYPGHGEPISQGIPAFLDQAMEHVRASSVHT